MGFYINPKGQSKEEWLNENAVAFSHQSPTTHFNEAEDMGVVCLIDNGGFTAAGVAYSARELEAFKVADGRYRVWFAVPVAKLEEVLGASRKEWLK